MLYTTLEVSCVNQKVHDLVKFRS